jgi:hypothetical protein
MTTLFRFQRALLFALLGSFLATGSVQAAEKPLKVLLITGGCCHDYAKQKDLLKKGIEERAHAEVTQIHVDVAPGPGATKPPLPIYGNPDYAKGYDVVIHDECAADISDPEVIKGVLAPHRAGIPGINLHCAMHSYRIGKPGDAATAGSERSMWFDYLGLQSSRHGPQEPIAITHAEKKHPITRGLADWTTVKEELYNNIQVFPSATPLATGKQMVRGEEVTSVVTWVNDFNGTRIFSTTIGHNNTTVEDPKYLELVTRGILWATKHLNDDGTPAKGYGPGGK